MKYFFISLLSISAAMTGCKSSTEPTNPPRTAYQRAAGMYFDSFAGKDSTMDACLALGRQFSVGPPDSTIWTSTAAFNIGDYRSLIGLVSIGGQAMPWDNANDNYELRLPKIDSMVWTVENYNSMNFSETAKMPAKMECLNHPDMDTVSKSSGFTIKYSGAGGGMLSVSGFFYFSHPPLKDSVGFIDFPSVPDTGSVTFSPDALKEMPVGCKMFIELRHDLFYSKVISQNTVSHKIGFYTQTESDLFLTLGK
jgi:hypothetical protein